MIGIVDWAGNRARMVLAFIALSILAGTFAYLSLPKEGEPDIEIPAIFVSVPFPGISAQDAETLLVEPMEAELGDLDGLKKMSANASEGYAGVALEFEFGWDRTRVIADVRDRMNSVEAKFPDGADKYSINEINFSEFPVIIVNLTGDVPERTLVRVAKELQEEIEGLEPVLEANLTGQRDEVVEVIIDPLKLEAYNVTANELIGVVRNNNQLIAAGEVETESGAFSVKIPSSFNDLNDVRRLPVKVNSDSVVTLGDLADIRLTFEARKVIARYNGEPTVALQIVKRKGFNLLDTSNLVREVVETQSAQWPAELKAAVSAGFSNDQSIVVNSMVRQLEGSVLTAIALVMIVVLASLGTRSALLVGFSIPTSFLLCFALLAVMGVTISNIVMFGLILAVGMLVDGAIVVVEYADKRIQEGTGPMRAYVEAAKRMFWPIVSSTATTLCAFLPMLFWPGVPGEFMGMLPVTLIFVLSASLVVALVYLPVMGGVAGRMSRSFEHTADLLLPLPWVVRALLVPIPMAGMFGSALLMLNPTILFGQQADTMGFAAFLPGAILFLASAILASVTLEAAKIHFRAKRVQTGYKRSPFGWVIHIIAGNPVMPLVAIAAVITFVGYTFITFSQNSRGVEFFVESETEQAIIYVRARGNLSLENKDDLVKKAEAVVLAAEGIDSAFAFAGSGGLNQNTAGASSPRDAIGQIQIELTPWESRKDNPALNGNVVVQNLQAELAKIPGIKAEILSLSRGPASSKPVHLRLKSTNWDDLLAAISTADAKFVSTPGLSDIEDSRPLPGIDWEIDVDVEKAGRYGADVATVGGMVQLVTRGILLDTMRVDSSTEEVDIRVRVPREDRVLATLDSLKIRTADGLVPMANFLTKRPVAKLGQISRVDQSRYLDIKAAFSANGLGAVSVTDENGETTDLGAGRVLETGTPASASSIVLETFKSQNVFERLTGAEKQSVRYEIVTPTAPSAFLSEVRNAPQDFDFAFTPMTANERKDVLTDWIETEAPFAGSVSYEWAGDAVDQAESQEFLQSAFLGALGLMFVILLAQFNSFYNSVLVLLAVVLSTTGVLIGMMVMDQTFSIIMTGTGIVALAGIVVNNNIVLIDTYQEYNQYMPKIEAIVRTAEARIRPVLLTTITTMAGLTPMMFGLSLDFFAGGYSVDSPTALWWKQLATAVVFGLGIATVLTLVFTPAMLALRVWLSAGAYRSFAGLQALSLGPTSAAARDRALGKSLRKIDSPEIVWQIEELAPLPAVTKDPAPAALPAPSVKQIAKPSPDFIDTGAEALDSVGEQIEAEIVKTVSPALMARAEQVAQNQKAKPAAKKRKAATKKKPAAKSAKPSKAKKDDPGRDLKAAE